MLFVRHIFSRPTRRVAILVGLLNVVGLAALMIGVFPLSEFRAGLIDERLRGLEGQGEIVAYAVTNAATSDSDHGFSDWDHPLALTPGETIGSADKATFGPKFSIDPQRSAQILHRSMSATGNRARIYDPDGILIIDSHELFMPGDMTRLDLPPPADDQPSILERAWKTAKTRFNRGDLPLYRELGPNAGKDYPEIARVLAGESASSMVRVDAHGRLIISVALPLNSRAVRGALLLTTQADDISDVVETQQFAILKVFLIVTGVMVLLSLLLAATIIRPEFHPLRIPPAPG